VLLLTRPGTTAYHHPGDQNLPKKSCILT